jgi:hypothetical protein
MLLSQDSVMHRSNPSIQSNFDKRDTLTRGIPISGRFSVRSESFYKQHVQRFQRDYPGSGSFTRVLFPPAYRSPPYIIIPSRLIRRHKSQWLWTKNVNPSSTPAALLCDPVMLLKLAWVLEMSGRCQADVRQMSGRCQADVRQMSKKKPNISRFKWRSGRFKSLLWRPKF